MHQHHLKGVREEDAVALKHVENRTYKNSVCVLDHPIDLPTILDRLYK